MDSGMESLKAMIGTPYKASESIATTSDRWKQSETRLGVEFPPDYKNLVEIYGTHAWAGFLHTLIPGHVRRSLELETRGLRILGALLEAAREYPGSIEYPIYPERCGLYPWGVTDNGDILCWLTQGYPNWWPTVVINTRGGSIEKHAMTASALIASFLDGTLQSPLLLGPFDGKRPQNSDPGWEDGCY